MVSFSVSSFGQGQCAKLAFFGQFSETSLSRDQIVSWLPRLSTVPGFPPSFLDEMRRFFVSLSGSRLNTIQAYKASNSYLINGNINSGGVTGNYAQYQASVSRLIEIIETAPQPPGEFVTYRGQRVFGRTNYLTYLSLSPGSIYRAGRFTSTSIDSSVAVGFLDLKTETSAKNGDFETKGVGYEKKKHGGYKKITTKQEWFEFRVFYRIRKTQGARALVLMDGLKPGSHIIGREDEKEVLFSPEQKFVVLDIVFAQYAQSRKSTPLIFVDLQTAP